LQATDSNRLDFVWGVEESELLSLLDRFPNFGLYHDVYFITGIPLDRRISGRTADAKFQISVRQRLFKSLLPFNTMLLLTYTQKSFWRIYERSLPFADTNYAPGLLLGKSLVAGSRLRGVVCLSLEHESNGQDSIQSRSWDYLMLTGAYFIDRHISLQGKLWAGWLGKGNRDLFRYRGYGLMACHYRTADDRCWISLAVNPRGRLGNFNTRLEINLKISPNRYIFLQWYDGYGEGLLLYNQYTSMVRVGICFKPFMSNIY
jgi:phospholipase A1